MSTITTTDAIPTTPAPVLVFDAGKGNNFSVSGIQFRDGLVITNKAKEIELIRNYIEQTGEQWPEAEFNSSLPRHAHASIPPSMAHVVTGIQTSSSLGSTDNQLAKSIIDGSYTDLAKTPDSGISPETLVAAQLAAQAAVATPTVPTVPKINIKKKSIA